MALSLACCISSGQAAQRVPLIVTEPAGIPHRASPVTSGVPFPMGALKTNQSVRLLDELGRAVPLQVRTTATWRDGSVKWLLLDFQAGLAPNESRQYTLEYGEGVSAIPAASALKFEDSPLELWVINSPLRFSIPKSRFGVFENVAMDKNHDHNFSPNEILSISGLIPSLKLASNYASVQFELLQDKPPVIEEFGPLRGVIKVTGWVTANSTNRLVHYLARIKVFAGSPAVQVDFTITQLSDSKMLWLKDLSLNLQSTLGFNPNLGLKGLSSDTTTPGNIQFAFGDQSSVHSANVSAAEAVTLSQLQESAYTISNGASLVAAGFKAPGWLQLRESTNSILVGNRFFWQQFPKSLSVSSNYIRIGLYPEECGKPFDLDQGLAKTHEIYFDFEPDITRQRCREKIMAWENPLFAVAPSQWYCDSRAFGDLLPFDFDLFPDYETLTEASGDQFIRKMATGWRHWGDYYYGGEYKGTNSYMNLEYDVHHNFYCQFVRTGLRKYLDTAITMAKHQADIDTNHKTGWQWKHSPRHVEIQAEFGHTFTRGLLETWYLTGNRRCFDAAIELGDYFAKQIRVPRELGNERQIGWSLISLLPVYEATWDEKYLAAARETIDRLISGMEEKGKFKIRWDNRIAFFNGIAATGFIYYYRATGDERVANAAMAVIRRARGFYPEYAGRTLEAIAWAYQRTHDPNDLDFLQRTWETTMARQIDWNVMELGAPTIFTVHALPFMAQGNFFEKTERPLRLTPGQFDTASGLYAHHLPGGEAELFLKNESAQPLDLVIIRKGAWKAPGAAVVYGGSSKPIETMEFGKQNTIWQRRPIALTAPAPGIYRLVLSSANLETRKGGSFITWDVAASRPMRAVFSTPEARGLEFVTPALYTIPAPGASKIKIDLAGQGEGFKKAIIYDPDGNVAGSMEAFIDLGDKSRYEYKVEAKIPERFRNAIWSISLQDVAAQGIEGLCPYFATSKGSFFKLP